MTAVQNSAPLNHTYSTSISFSCSLFRSLPHSLSLSLSLSLSFSLPRSPAAYIPSTGYWLQTGSWFCLLGPVNKLSITSGIISLS